MAIIEHLDGAHAALAITDKFVFNDSVEFRKKLFGLFEGNIRSLSINLQELSFMDSSGLGMLMVAQNECQSRNISMSIHRPQGEVQSLLEMTKSYERFKIVS